LQDARMLTESSLTCVKSAQEALEEAMNGMLPITAKTARPSRSDYSLRSHRRKETRSPQPTIT
jgi:hypothetical protein